MTDKDIDEAIAEAAALITPELIHEVLEKVVTDHTVVAEDGAQTQVDPLDSTFTGDVLLGVFERVFKDAIFPDRKASMRGEKAVRKATLPILAEATWELAADEARAKSEFVPYDLTEFLRRKALWAANYFVLWPLGLALTATVEDEVVTRLDVREWAYPEGELGETIEEPSDLNLADYEVFLGFVRERVLAMKPDERKSAIGRLSHNEIASGIQLMIAKP